MNDQIRQPQTSLHTPLVLNVAARIRDLMTSGEVAIGQKLVTQSLADQFDVSRSPVREALLLLAEQGLLEQIPNRGFFAKAMPESRGDPAEPLLREAGSAYHRIADDWLADRIPSDITEQMLRDRYGLTKGQVSEILVRATREGWAEPKQGYGWKLLAVAKTAESFEQIYRFRMIIEPAGMLEPSFKLDLKVVADLRRTQERMLEGDIARLPAERLLENGAIFHEELLRLSGNPFMHMSLVRVNRMRRLMEYQANLDRNRLTVQCTDHLRILDVLERNELLEASYLMRQHLSGALARKMPTTAPGD